MKFFVLCSTVTTLTFSLLLLGCGGGGGGGGGNGTTPSEFCEAYSKLACAKMYECFSEQELDDMNFPGSESACAVKLINEVGCSAITTENFCDPNESYYSNETGSCLQQYDSLSCGQIRSALSDDGLDGLVPACNRVCRIE